MAARASGRSSRRGTCSTRSTPPSRSSPSPTPPRAGRPSSPSATCCSRRSTPRPPRRPRAPILEARRGEGAHDASAERPPRGRPRGAPRRDPREDRPRRDRRDRAGPARRLAAPRRGRRRAGTVERLLAEEARASSDRATTVERLRQERVRLDGELGALDAARRAAELARERRLVRAPTAGRLGELPELRPGDLVAVGAALGTIVPDGELRAVAWFRAERALGWLRPGARATVRLDAFPWTWFGVVGAEVTEAALEPKDGLVRVELAIADDAGLLPGTASPARWRSRSTGRARSRCSARRGPEERGGAP
ncbi:MAG: HlyD family secretion protein [Sandaracinaceae bacterium]